MADSQKSLHQEPMRFVETVKQDEISGQFKLNHAKFASLGDPEDFTSLKEKLVEINIESLLDELETESYFEVTLPMTGMTDFLSKDPTWEELPQQFPSIIAINGFGAGQSENSFPKPYFIMATDIVGNEYEILVNDQGQVEVPEQGLGLFSVLSSMTFIYSASQILDGKGFSDFQELGAKSGVLYLLPPPGLDASFTPTLSISHLDDYLQREVDFQVKVPIQAHQVDEPTSKIEYKVETLEDEMGTQLHIQVQGENPNPRKPYKLSVELESMSDVGYHFENQTFEEVHTQHAGWSQTADNVFEKSLNLSDYAKTALVRGLMSEFDFTKSLLQGESWGLEQQNGFNDLGLRPEAIGPIYDLIVDGVVHHKIPGDYLFSHIPDSHMSELDLSYASLDQADQTTVDYLIAEAQAFNFSPLQDMLSGEMQEVIDDFYVYMVGPVDHMPQIHVTFVPMEGSSPFMDDIDLHIPDLEFLNFNEVAAIGSGDQVQNFIDLPNEADVYAREYDTPVSLALNHVATTIHYEDIMDFSDSGDLIKGFDVQNDKIDLSGLLEKMPGATIEDIQLKSQGEDIHISITAEDGQALPVATLVGAASPEMPNDLSGIIVHPDMG